MSLFWPENRTIYSELVSCPIGCTASLEEDEVGTCTCEAGLFGNRAYMVNVDCINRAGKTGCNCTEHNNSTEHSNSASVATVSALQALLVIMARISW